MSNLFKSYAAFRLLTLLLLFSLQAFPVYASDTYQHGLIITDDKAFPPFAFLDAEGNPRGITIDIWTLWSKKTGIPVKFDLMEWNEALQAVREGRADAVGGLFLTPERKVHFDYTKEITKIPTAIFFHQQIAGIKGLEDLSGFHVGVIKGDSSEELLRTEHPKITLLVYASTEELVKAAIAGHVKVFMADEPVALFYLAKYPRGDTFRRASREIALNPQYAAVRKGNKALLSTVQSGFDRISEAEITAIVTEWAGQSTRMSIPWQAIGLTLALILLFVMAVLVWNLLLHRQVSRATRRLTEKNLELERSREVIRLSEARYRELIEHANSIILRMDQDGRIIFFNEFAQRFFGFPQEEVIGKNVIGTIVPEQESTGRDLGAMIKDIAKNPDVYTRNENENMRRNGERVWIAWSNKPVFGPNGEINEILCIGNDITDHKRAEEVIRQSEERFAKAFQSSPAPLVISEIETGRLINVNDAWVKMLGYPREDQIGRTSKEIGIWMNPDDRDRIVQILLSHGSFKEEPIRFKTKTGQHVHALWSAETVTLGTQKVMLSMIYDETERKNAEEALRQSEARLNSVIEGTNVGTWEWNVQTGETVFNERWAEMIGYKLADLAPVSIRTWTDLAHPEDLQESEKQLAQVFARERPLYDIEHRLKHRNGDWIWVHDRGKVIEWSVDGKPARMAGTHTDITERKQAEQKIIEYNQLLHSILAASPVGIGRVKDRTISWVNDTLCAMSGYTEQEMQGQDSSLFYENLEEFERVGKLVYKAGQAETRLVRKDGGVRDALIQIAPADSESYIFTITDITQQKKDEADLKFFKHVLESARDSFFGVGVDAKILYVNDSTCHLLGYTQDEILKMNLWDIDPVYPREKWVDFLFELRQNDSMIFESTHRKKDGTIFPVEISANLHRYRGAEYIFAFVRDISQRKKMTEELIKAQGLLNAAFMQSPSGILIADGPDVRIKMANPAALGIRGVESQHLIDIDVDLHSARWQIFRPDGRPFPPAELPLSRSILKGEICRNVEAVIRNERGEDRWVLANAAPVRDSQDNIIAGIVIFDDISDSKRMEAAIRESEERFKAIFEESPISIVLSDYETGRYIDVNSFFCIANHLEKDLIIGKTPVQIGISIDSEAQKHLRELLTKNKKIDLEEIRIRGRDGKDYTVIISSRLIQIAGRQLVLSALQDITERKHSEEAINRLQEQLRQAQKMEAIGTLAGGIAHDFNNILGSVMGYTELALMSGDDEGIKPYLEQVLKASDRAKALVTQILTFSRQSKQEKKSLSVTPIFKEVIKLLRSSLPANIQIRQNFSCSYDTILADPTQIYQILMNLGTNAAHAMRKDGGYLDISLETENTPNPGLDLGFDLKAGTYLKLVVRDTGCGMVPSVMEHIFEPFFTTKKEGEGTGLGLSVVYGIVKNHGGSVHVASQPNQGTAFTILLPLIEQAEAWEDETATLIPGGRGRILLVDDEEALAQLGREMLTSLGYEVTLRYSSPDAFEVFRTKPHHFDLVITDMTMPNMSGALLAREMLKIRHDLPIILVTGFSEKINEEEAKHLGIKAFMLKPISLANLSQTVRKVLDQKESDIP